jgi:hypothetical protein
MKLIAIFLLSFLCGLAALEKPLEVIQVDPPPGPTLASPATLATNKAGRVRFEVKTSCKNVVYLVDDEKADMAREFTDATTFRYHFSADAPGVYKVVFVAASGDVPLVSQTVITYDGNVPVPPPGPAPGPVPPGPNPGPNPGQLTKLYVVVIEDTAAAKAGRAAYFANDALLARIKSKGWVLRVESKDVLNAAGQTPPDLVPYLSVSKGKEPYLFLVNEKGQPLFEGSLPDTPAALLSLIQKVGG